MQHRRGINYYSTCAEALEVRDTLTPEYPDARVVEYDLGWAVQYDFSGPYYPEASD